MGMGAIIKFGPVPPHNPSV